jgi:glycosyltransferase involved in cell wall biosynthesis
LSDTDAQKKFLIDYPNVGFVYQIGNSEQLANIIMMLYNDRNLLSNIKNNALKLATDNLNWENEGQILLKKVNSLITAY